MNGLGLMNASMTLYYRIGFGLLGYSMETYKVTVTKETYQMDKIISDTILVYETYADALAALLVELGKDKEHKDGKKETQP